MQCGKRCGPGDVRTLGGDASGMHGQRPIQRLGVRAHAERTRNMLSMVVILDVSKLSGWLNADAPCRVEGRADDAERGAGREAGERVRQRRRERRALALS